jgi:hypothetical protein
MTVRPLSGLAGLGQTLPNIAPGVSVGGGILPGSPCYDGSHDTGEAHCSTLASVALSAINPFSTGQTTTCSASEQTCLAACGGNCSGSDVCASTIGLDCPTIAILVVLGFVLIKVLAK